MDIPVDFSVKRLLILYEPASVAAVETALDSPSMLGSARFGFNRSGFLLEDGSPVAVAEVRIGESIASDILSAAWVGVTRT